MNLLQTQCYYLALFTIKKRRFQYPALIFFDRNIKKNLH